MDYQKHYEQLIAKHGSQEKPEGYSERHHILPKSMGGSDDASNLVYLSAKAHFVAHHLLWRWHRNKSMAFAFHMMCNIDPSKCKGRHKPSAFVYQEAKAAHSVAMSGRVVSAQTREKLRELNLGKLASEETKAKIKASNTGLKRSKTARENIANSKLGKGHPRARVANIFLEETGGLLACGVVLREWARENGYHLSVLSRTARLEQKAHKGIYARYI